MWSQGFTGNDHSCKDTRGTELVIASWVNRVASESVLMLCEIVFILCARSHWNFPFDVVSKIFAGSDHRCEETQEHSEMLSLRLGTILSPTRLDGMRTPWEFPVVAISKSLQEVSTACLSFLINHVATEIVFSLGADTLEFSI